jgi:hypothetical protein
MGNMPPLPATLRLSVRYFTKLTPVAMDGKLQQHWSVINKSMGRAASHILSRQFHKFAYAAKSQLSQQVRAAIAVRIPRSPRGCSLFLT